MGALVQLTLIPKGIVVGICPLIKKMFVCIFAKLSPNSNFS